MYTYIYINRHIYIYACTKFIDVIVCVHVHLCARLYALACMSSCFCACVRAFACAYLSACVHVTGRACGASFLAVGARQKLVRARAESVKKNVDQTSGVFCTEAGFIWGGFSQ